MRKGIGLILLLVSLSTAVLVASIVFKADYWIAKPHVKFIRSWQEDVLLLEQSNKLPKQWQMIREISVRAANSPAQDWVTTAVPPIQTNKSGTYRLDVFVIHWLEDIRYGVVIQYNLVDLRNQNTVWELGRTLKLGYVY